MKVKEMVQTYQNIPLKIGLFLVCKLVRSRGTPRSKTRRKDSLNLERKEPEGQANEAKEKEIKKKLNLRD